MKADWHRPGFYQSIIFFRFFEVDFEVRLLEAPFLQSIIAGSLLENAFWRESKTEGILKIRMSPSR